MDKQQILEEIRSHLVSRGLDADAITMEAELGRDLDLDSLDTVELTLGLEKRLDIEIPDEELEDLVTVGDAVELISQKVSVRA